MNAQTIIMPADQPTTALAAPVTPRGRDYNMAWMQYFSIPMALDRVEAHVAGLPGHRTEGHTMTAYKQKLGEFLRYAAALVDEQPPAHPLPNPALIEGFIAHLSARGLSARTINGYLNPLRHYLRALADQDMPTDVTLETYIHLTEWRETIRRAADVKHKAKTKRTHLAPMWSEGIRLDIDRVNATLRQIDRRTLAGKRDYALLLLAFSSGLRIAELARVTRDDFTTQGDQWIATVRGKYNNYDPVPVSAAIVAAIDEWITAYNAAVGDGAGYHPINGTSSLWRHILRDDAPKTGSADFSTRSLSRIIGERTERATNQRLAAHDTRRTCAYLAYKAGMSLENIRGLLRHSSIAITAVYIGTEPDYSGSTLANYITLG